MSFEITGKVIKIYETEQKTASFQAREFVIESVEGQYNQFIKFQLTQDRCGLIDSYQEQDEIKVHFDLRGREWQGRYFTNLNAWRIEPATATAPEGSADAPPPSEIPTGMSDGISTEDSVQAEDFDDLPF